MKRFRNVIFLGLVAGFFSSCSCDSCRKNERSSSSSEAAMEEIGKVEEKKCSPEDFHTNTSLDREEILEKPLKDPENIPYATAETTERWETSWNDTSLEKVYPSGQHSAY